MDKTPSGSSASAASSGARIAEEHRRSPSDDLGSLQCPLHCTLTVGAGLPRRTEDIRADLPPEWGGVLQIGNQQFQLSQMAVKKLGALLSNPAWFTNLARHGSVFVADCNVPLVLLKWARSLEASVLHHQARGIPMRPIDQTVAVHEITHFGELPHSIRHLVRGGCIAWLGYQDAAVKAVRSLSPAQEAEYTRRLREIECMPRRHAEEKADALRRLEGEFLQKPEVLAGILEARHGALDLYNGLLPLCASDYTRVIPLLKPKHLESFGHTDLHYAQVPADPLEFVDQLRRERDLPAQIEKTEGYREVEAEVRRQLGTSTFDLIVWHRNVGTFNRSVRPAEHQACLEGARLALENIGNQRVLDLGDPVVGCVGNSRLLGCHVAGERGRRTILQQLQFLRAVVSVSEARLIVAERTGLADLVSLVGGIPMCQFIGADVREGNDRLLEVCRSGGSCMGNAVGPSDGRNLSSLVRNGCEGSMRDDTELGRELALLRPATASASSAAAAAAAAASSSSSTGPPRSGTPDGSGS